MFVNFIIFSLLLKRSPILLFHGLGASRLVKNDIDVWPPKLPFFFISS